MDLKSAARVISHQKQNLGPRRPSFHVKNRILPPTEARFAGFGYTSASIGATNGAFGYTFPHKNTPGNHVALTLHGRPVTQTGNQRIMEQYEFSETERQLLRALSEGKTPEELEQLFDTDVLETDLNRLQELKMAVAHFSA